MEKRLRRIEITVFAVLILSLINFIQPHLSKLFESKTTIKEIAETKDLPSDLTRDYLDKTVYKLKTDFNRSNWEDLYNIYGDYAKAQLSDEDIESGFKKLKSAIGNIGNYSYSHYLYEGNGSNAEWFEIHYKCRFDNGKGTIKVTTRTTENKSEITGIVISLDEI